MIQRYAIYLQRKQENKPAAKKDFGYIEYYRKLNTHAKITNTANPFSKLLEYARIKNPHFGSPSARLQKEEARRDFYISSLRLVFKMMLLTHVFRTELTKKSFRKSFKDQSIT